MLVPGWPWVAREKKTAWGKNPWAWLTLGSGEKWELRTPPPIDSVSHTEPHFKAHPSVLRSPWELIRKWYWTLLLLFFNDKKGDWRQEAQSCSWGRGTPGPSPPMLQSSEDNRESRRGKTPPSEAQLVSASPWIILLLILVRSESWKKTSAERLWDFHKIAFLLYNFVLYAICILFLA